MANKIIYGILIATILFLLFRSPKHDTNSQVKIDSLYSEIGKLKLTSDSLTKIVRTDSVLLSQQLNLVPQIKIRYEKVKESVRVLDADSSVSTLRTNLSSR